MKRKYCGVSELGGTRQKVEFSFVHERVQEKHMARFFFGSEKTQKGYK